LTSSRPIIRVFERHRVPAPVGSPVVYKEGEGFFADIVWETELRVGEDLNIAVRRALTELQAKIAGNLGSGGKPSTSSGPQAESMQDRINRVLGEGRS